MSYAQLIGDWQALVVLFVAGVVPNQIWRMLGLWFGGGIDEGSELLVWVRAIATAIPPASSPRSWWSRRARSQACLIPCAMAPSAPASSCSC